MGGELAGVDGDALGCHPAEVFIGEGGGAASQAVRIFGELDAGEGDVRAEGARFGCEALPTCGKQAGASGEDGVEGGEARFLGAALKRNCTGARIIMEQVCEDLAWAISHVVHLFDPEVVILGGGLSLLGEPLRGGAAEHLPQCLCPTYRPGPEIRLAALGEDVVGIGALLLAIQKSNQHE